MPSTYTLPPIGRSMAPQQDKVRHNREYDFLTKEIEFQTLEIELCEKRIKEYSADKEEKEAEVTKNDRCV